MLGCIATTSPYSNSAENWQTHSDIHNDLHSDLHRAATAGDRREPLREVRDKSHPARTPACQTEHQEQEAEQEE